MKWDEAKHRSNIRKHDLDLADAEERITEKGAGLELARFAGHTVHVILKERGPERSHNLTEKGNPS